MTTYKCERTKPCAQCPFTRRGSRGWIGPYRSTMELHEAGVHEAGYPCHVSQKETSEGGRPFQEAHQCVGAIMYASNAFKSYRTPEMEALRLKLKAVMDPMVFRNIREFRDYHESLPCMKCGAKTATVTDGDMGVALCASCKGGRTWGWK